MRLCAFRPKLELLDERSLPSFSPAVSYPVGDGPEPVATGDFNRDTIPDLAVADSYGGVRILLGNGDGSLTTAGAYSQGMFAMSMVAGDLNGDGALDLAVVGNSASVHVLVGNGDGSFQSPQTFELGGYYSSVAAGDLNADGALDLVVGGSRSISGCDDYGCWGQTFGEVNVLLGHGDGTFSLVWNQLSYPLVSDIALADLNGDGNLDAAVTGSNPSYTSGGTLMIFLGTGNGGLRGGASYGTNSFLSVAAADVNGDGRTDLLVAERYSQGDTIGLFLGQGDGNFQAQRALPVGDPWGLTSVAIGDFNRDGRADIAAASSIGDGVRVLLGKGDGNFRTPVGYPVGSSTLDLAVVDLNRDGFPDLAATNYASDSISVLRNDGLGWGNEVPAISISDVTKKEGKKNQKTLFTFTVTLSAPYDQPVTVSFRTADGTATAADRDYVTQNGTLTFAPGQTTKTITIIVTGDNNREADETFFVDLTGASIDSPFTKKRGVGTILNDD